ncbi:RsbRD N-terminal domain-containing protein [Desulfacinum hydrothermale]|nr:RsbRD N-terminal domain-containing protein [Desulfacinum hydrothermale]
MNLTDYLRQNQKAILKDWFQTVVDAYPAETAAFLRKEKDPFANPVGSSILEGLQGVYAQVVEGVQEEQVAPFLDRVIRIRAVQDFTPAQALSFVFSLKEVVQSRLEEEGRLPEWAEDLRAMEAAVDQVALMAFNIYMECREKVYELRVEEVKNRTARLLERANAIWASQREGEGSQEES